MKHILVTGGSGFIGSHIVKLSERVGHDVTIYDVVKPRYENEAKFIAGDIVDFHIPRWDTYDIVFHCAGMVGTEVLFANPYHAESVNVLGTIALLDWAKSQPLGKSPVIVQTNLMGDWNNPYMMSKNQGERYGKMYHSEWGVKYVSVSPTDVYGPRQSMKQKKAAPTFIMAALKGEKLPIYGDGGSWVNYVYAKDVARCALSASDGVHAGETIYFSHPDNDMSTVDFAKKVIERVWTYKPELGDTFNNDLDSAIAYQDMRSGQPGTVGRIPHVLDLAKTVIDFSTLVSLDDGLDIAIRWYASMLNSQATKAEWVVD